MIGICRTGLEENFIFLPRNSVVKFCKQFKISRGEKSCLKFKAEQLAALSLEMPTYTTNVDDHDIVRRVTAGDINAFGVLVQKYQGHILAVVGNHIPFNQTEEVAHEVFVKAYRSLGTFKFRGGFKQWLSAIAVRTCYDFWRKEYRSREIPMSSCSEEEQNFMEKALANQFIQATSQENSQEEARELLDRALDKLSPEDRIVLELVYFEGLSAKEAAGLLGWSVANVKIRIFRSRKKLRKIITRFLEK
ncbi:MAG: sigma-70 family RNA polymerase sigma factor [Thermodesulfobacteriota bacterium]|nr:MAG: sigma-70 family RNA polymerase sigma factor [Thermodesulfobacteriota bacterium]